jgi:hypothetical protein
VHGLASGQKPSQKCWPGVGFGLAWTSWKPKPMAQAMALSSIFWGNFYPLYCSGGSSGSVKSKILLGIQLLLDRFGLIWKSIEWYYSARSSKWRFQSATCGSGIVTSIFKEIGYAVWNLMLSYLKQHSHIATYWLIPCHPGLVLAHKVARMVYLAYIQVLCSRLCWILVELCKSHQIWNIAQPPPF